MTTRIHALAALAGAAVVASAASAGSTVQILVTVENLAPTNSVGFSALNVGFGTGVYDGFDAGSPASAETIAIAEGGNGGPWFSAFQAADPGAVTGVIGAGGPLLPGGTASAVFELDTVANRYFSFGSMVIPSNDHFIGNDDPLAYEIFDAAGNLAITSISQFGSQVWNAGSEITDPTAAAFLVGSVNANRTPENGVVEFDLTALAAYAGLETAAGYIFDPQITGSDEIYRISFAVVPAPGGFAVLGLCGLAAARRRR